MRGKNPQLSSFTGLSCLFGYTARMLIEKKKKPLFSRISPAYNTVFTLYEQKLLYCHYELNLALS